MASAAAQQAQAVRDLKKELAGGQKAELAPKAKLTESSLDANSPNNEDKKLNCQQKKAVLREAARALNVPAFDVPQRVAALMAEIQTLRDQLKTRKAAGPLSADALLAGAEQIEGVNVIVAETPGANPGELRRLVDQLRKKASPVAMLIAAVQSEDKIVLLAALSRDLVERGLHAGDWVREVAKTVGGSGGGKPDMAQAGGKNPEKVADAITKAKDEIRQMLKG